MDILKLIGRKKTLFDEDIRTHDTELTNSVKLSSFLIIGGAGSIGQNVVQEIFARNPRILHVVDISENNIVELIRNIRSSLGYIDGEFKTFVIDCSSEIFDAFVENQKNYDYILNLSALKHVRSEKDPYTLMRMIEVNILNTKKMLEFAERSRVRNYFSVSTDKATNPVNMMGASKLIMEMFLFHASQNIHVSTARFANVAFSEGSLLYGFNKRIEKGQPLTAPSDVRRYFMLPKESGELCLMSCLLAQNRDLFFPKVNKRHHLTRFSDIAVKYLEQLGYTPYICDSETEAREMANELIPRKKWPCYFFDSDTSGEKLFEEFYTENNIVDWDKFRDIAVIKNEPIVSNAKLERFIEQIDLLKRSKTWKKKELIDLFSYVLQNFHHDEKDKYLDEKM